MDIKFDYELLVDLPMPTPAYNYIAKKGQVLTYMDDIQFHDIYVQACSQEYSFNSAVVENNPQWFRKIENI